MLHCRAYIGSYYCFVFGASRFGIKMQGENIKGRFEDQ